MQDWTQESQDSSLRSSTVLTHKTGASDSSENGNDISATSHDTSNGVYSDTVSEDYNSPVSELDIPEQNHGVKEKSDDISVSDMRVWLRNWISQTTGLPYDKIDEDRPIEEFGLASKDAIALSGDIEDLTGTFLSATVAYQNPTIASLAQYIIEGEPESAGQSEEEFAIYTTKTSRQKRHDEIAIVGLATRFPGAGDTPESTWEMLIEGKDGVRDLPENRWEEFRKVPELQETFQKANFKGGYLDDVKGFDAEFFSMSPREVEMVDPQQRLALELSWEALEHAHIPASSIKGSQVGVYLGSSSNDYQLLIVADLLAANPYAITGTSSSVIANRVSYFFDFHGPSITTDTACSSSLVSIHHAVRDLRNNEINLALAGGVNMLITPPVTLGFDQLGIQAPDGKIKAFSSNADGMIRAEGGGIVVLKRLSDAQRDGDTILAVISGSAVNQDGRSNGLPAPNPDAQVQLLRAAYKDASIDPRLVDYLEAHGTGTVLGDPIEADALGKAMARAREENKQLLLGSVKTNYGHLEAAAGVAGLIKVILALQENILPPSLNYAGPSPYIPFARDRLLVVDSPREWPRYSGTAIAGVSALGIGGTNAHVVVREATPEDYLPLEEDDEATNFLQESSELENFAEVNLNNLPVPLCISAFLPSRKRKTAEQLANWLEGEGTQYSLKDIGRTLARRNHGRTRSVIFAKNHGEAVKALRAIADGKPGGNFYTSDSPDTASAAWILSGYGSQHRKMAKQLYLDNPVFRKYFDEVNELIIDESGNNYVDLVLDDSQTYGVETSQVGIFAIQIALYHYFKDRGADAGVVIGHSMGEASAAYIAGGLSLADAVRVICQRSRLMGEGEAMLFGDWIRRMAIVEYSAEDIEAVLTDYPDLEVCVYAAPTHTVIGGPENQVQALVEHTEEQGKLGRMLETRGASHTRQMEPLLGEFTAEIMGMETKPLEKGLYSSVDREQFYKVGDTPNTVEYFIKGLRHAVWFSQAVAKAIESGHRTFIELSPNPVTLMSVAAVAYNLSVIDVELIQTLKRKEDENLTMLQALMKLYVHGHPVAVEKLFGKGDYAPVPRTAFVRKDYWIDVKLSAGGSMRPPGSYVNLPDGKHAWELSAAAAPELTALIRAAATQILPGSDLTAFVEHDAVGDAESITTILTPHPGGGAIQVHAKDSKSFRLLADAVIATDVTGIVPVISPMSESAKNSIAVQNTFDEFEAEYDEIHGKWSEESGETIEHRLTLIVGQALGYDPDDLPKEIPLVDLGLDSLTAMRIKNRVEYEFEIPPLQLTAMREACLKDVCNAVTYAVNNRAEVQALYEHQINEAKVKAEAAIDPVVKDSKAKAKTVKNNRKESLAARSTVNIEDKSSISDATGADVPPRDAAERLTFATWALVTGSSAGGVFNPLPVLDDSAAQKLATRLAERTGAKIDYEELLNAGTIEEMSNIVRQYLEEEIRGIVRTLREVPNHIRKPLFVFHPAGGSTVAYDALLKRLPADLPVYGIERVEGTISERIEQYYPVIKEIQPEGPYFVFGWSLGGALAYGTAQALALNGDKVAYVGLLDAVRPRKPITDSAEEKRDRLERYAAFAKKTYDIGDMHIPVEQLLEAKDDEEMFHIVAELLKLSKAKIPGGIIEHQRTSFLDNRALLRLEPPDYNGYVVLYRADKMHDGAIELEPNYADVALHGEWEGAASDLEIVRIGGDHLSVIDEPYISKVAKHIKSRFAELNPGAKTSKSGKK